MKVTPATSSDRSSRIATHSHMSVLFLPELLGLRDRRSARLVPDFGAETLLACSQGFSQTLEDAWRLKHILLPYLDDSLSTC